MQKLLSAMRKAVSDYDMIQDNDRIAVGLSGGKDSVALLALLAAYRKFSPQAFDLHAVHIDAGFGTSARQLDTMRAYCDSIEVPFTVEKTEIAQIIEIRGEKSPCSLCAKMRRGALNTTAIRLGCNKLALGHHADDVAETFLLSMIYEGRLHTFSAVTYMSRMQMTMIRPLLYIEEKYLSGLARRYDLPVIDNPCPHDKHTQREAVKQLLRDIDERFDHAKAHILTALFHPERNDLLDPPISRK